MTSHRATGRYGRDTGISSLLGFIVGMVMLVASMATVVYFISSQPDPALEEGTQAQQASATRALQQLVGTTGQPANWDSTTASNDNVERAGLLAQGSSMLDLEKIHALRDGDMSADDLVTALGLDNDTYSIHVAGEIKSHPMIKPPPLDGWGLVHGTDGGQGDDHVSNWTLDEVDTDSWSEINRTCTLNSKCPKGVQTWYFGWNRDPSKGLGEIFVDHPWELVTGLIPKIAGVTATYSQRGTVNATTGAGEEAMYDDFTGDDGSNPSHDVMNWHVTNDRADCELPGTPSGRGNVLLAGNPREHASKSCNPGNPQWYADPMDRTWALFGPFTASSAETLELEMVQSLVVPRTISDGCGATADDPCWAPRILFWNGTSGDGQWDRIRPTHKGCSSGWNDQNPTNQTSWNSVTIDLCQALDDSLGDVWISLYWDSWCGNYTSRVSCTSEAKAARGYWGVDDVTFTKTQDGETTTLHESDFEPGQSVDELITLGTGWDAAIHRTGAFYDDGDVTSTPLDIPPITWPRYMVENRTHILAMAPGASGSTANWLGSVGLVGEDATGASEGSEVDSTASLVRFTSDLNETSAGYVTTANAWDDTASTSLSGPRGISPTAVLEIAHNTTGPQTATFLSGAPYADSGTVTALGYKLSDIRTNDPDLHRPFLTNTLASFNWTDPTFSLAGPGIPSDTGGEILTARRTVLASVEATHTYSVPMEITLYLWQG